MDRTTLVAQLSVEIIKQQIASGAKHPSPGLIKEAVAAAHGIVEELDLDLSNALEQRLGVELEARNAGLANAEKTLKAQASVIGDLAARISALETKPAPAPASAASAPVAPPAVAPAT
jgi:hypothetical protein